MGQVDVSHPTHALYGCGKRWGVPGHVHHDIPSRTGDQVGGGRIAGFIMVAKVVDAGGGGIQGAGKRIAGCCQFSVGGVDDVNGKPVIQGGGDAVRGGVLGKVNVNCARIRGCVDSGTH